MKTIFNKPTNFLKYALTFMCFAFLLGLIFSLTFGFNTSHEYGKVYEVSVFCFDESKQEAYQNATKEVLKSYGYSAKETFIEEHTDCDAIVVRYASESAVNATKIQAEIAQKLELNENLVQVDSLTLSNQKSASIKLLITLGVASLLIFVYTIIRFNWKTAITIASNLILSAILPLSVMAFSRIELSLTSLLLVIVMAILSTVLYMAIYSKTKSIQKQQEKPLSFRENYISLIENNKFKVLIPSALVLLVFVCLIFTFVRPLVFVGLSGIVAFAISAFNLIIFAPSMQMALNHEKEETNGLR